MLKDFLLRLCDKIGSFLNQNLTEEEKKRLRHSPLQRAHPWKKNVRSRY